MRVLSFLSALLTALLLAGCPEERGRPEEAGVALRLDEVLGGGDVAGFARATGPRTFAFPRDHAAHPAFRNEWWYLTGNLETADGRRFGYQTTFFSAALNPEESEAGGGPRSAWRSNRVWMAHAGLTDVRGRRHYARERFTRENPGLAGARLDPFRVWLENWHLAGAGDGDDTFPWRLSLDAEDFTLALELRAAGPPMLQGEQGLSRKGPEPGMASYYYSMTRLPTRGTVTVEGRTYRVEGSSWLDREWSTGALGPDQHGWDWFALQFDSGQALMYYLLRDDSGAAGPYSLGGWKGRDGTGRVVEPEEISFRPLATWTSPRGVDYTTRWRLDYSGDSWIIQAVLEDQWMDVSLPYWEGAVDILAAGSGEKVGQGYLEMVRE